MAKESSNGWIWALVAVIAVIIIAAIIIIVLVAIESEGVDAVCGGTGDKCKTGLTCVSGKCKKKDNEICDFDDQCASNICTDFKCVAPPTPVFPPCSATNPCTGTEICNIAEGKCKADFNEPCNVASDCFYKPAVCTGPAGLLTCRVGTGGTCTQNTDCVSNNCVNAPTGTCGPASDSPGPAFSPPPANTLLMGGNGMSMNGVSMVPRSRSILDSDRFPTPRTNNTFNAVSAFSAPTQTEMADDFRTPSPRDVKAPFKKIRKDMVMSRGDIKQSPVIDVTSYSNTVLALMKNGNIIRETDEVRDMVANNINLKRLESFNGTLYGVSVDGRMFKLNNDTFETKKWMWNVASFPTGVTHTSATLNGKHFWVQTADTGLLYDRKMCVVDKETPFKNKKRVYGNDRKTFIEIDLQTNTGMLYPNKSRVKDVAGAIITHENQLKVLRPSQTRLFSDIRLINWTPAYIKRSL
uniref:Transmembrane protein n=1 Tax=Pithovirus LCPAC304 TaxID=2506594 RepID=A0A481Z975_9VIRU|nr:MAG: transmembrane protein [Pithovirus LCPAC304]